MKKKVKIFDQTQLTDFFGGVFVDPKKTQSTANAINNPPIFDTYTVPIKQHKNNAGKIVVTVGQKVLKGEPLTQAIVDDELPVHAPTSGTITAIAAFPQTHPSGALGTSITMQADGEDAWCALNPRAAIDDLTTHEIFELIKKAGICGLGGAVFPTHLKAKHASKIKILIINGVECEPYITSDYMLIKEQAQEILQGALVLHKVLQLDEIVFAIKDHQPLVDAITAAQKLDVFASLNIKIRKVIDKYPSGGEKQLIEVLTGLEVPSGSYATDIGILMQNVGSLVAIKKAVYDDEPLIERVVTVTGEALAVNNNYHVRIGTAIADLLNYVDSGNALDSIIVGGPMMGFTLTELSVPVVKSTNCLLALPQQSQAEERDCIRCGLCVDACPIKLQPQQLYWYAKAKNNKMLERYNLADCIECGCCSYVCPSDIPLVQYYRQEKARLKKEKQEKELAAIAKVNFENRKVRLEQEAKARKAARHQANLARKANMTADHKDLIAESIKRVAAKKQQQQKKSDN